jgi:hypothetical protein
MRRESAKSYVIKKEPQPSSKRAYAGSTTSDEVTRGGSLRGPLSGHETHAIDQTEEDDGPLVCSHPVTKVPFAGRYFGMPTAHDRDLDIQNSRPVSIALVRVPVHSNANASATPIHLICVEGCAYT